MKKSLVFGLLGLVLGLSACPASESEAPAAAQPLRIGFIPSENNAEIQRNAQPLVDRLSQAVGQEVQPVMATDYTGLVEAFRNGRMDIAFLTPASYVMAHNEAGVKVILRAQRGDKAVYYSVIFTRKDAGIDNLSQLKGKTFAFGDNLSTAGYIFPLKMFKAAGVNPETDFENQIFSGGHDATVLAVYNKKVTAGATYTNDTEGKDSAWNHVLKPEQVAELKVLKVSEPIPADNICVSKELPAETAQKVQAFFEQLNSSPEGAKLIQDLYRIDKFVPATDADYQGIRTAFAESGIQLNAPAKPGS